MFTVIKTMTVESVQLRGIKLSKAIRIVDGERAGEGDDSTLNNCSSPFLRLFSIIMCQTARPGIASKARLAAPNVKPKIVLYVMNLRKSERESSNKK
jgi:hypothetical protein